MIINEIKSFLEEKKIIAIARGIAPKDSVKLAQALYNGGIRFMEFPFNPNNTNSTVTDECISLVSNAMKGKMFVGSGTTTSTDFVQRTYSAGGEFVISADMNVDVIKMTKNLGMISIPGAMSPSEVITAYNAGADYVKIFPAANLGVEYIKALKGPFGHIKYMAVGGINIQNIDDFIKAGCVGVGVGGSLVDKSLIENGKFEKITEIANAFVDAIK